MSDRIMPLFTADTFLDANKFNIRRRFLKEDQMHGHEFFEFAYVMSGSAVQQLGAQAFRVKQGDYFIMDLGSFHCYRENKSFEIVNCLFAPEYVSHALSNCPSLSGVLSLRPSMPGVLPSDPSDRIYHDTDGRIRYLVEEMEKEYQAKQPSYLEMIRCHFIEILVRTIRMPVPEDGPGKHHPAVAAMVQHIGESWDGPLALSELSRQLGYTPQYLCSLFRKETGMSPGRYLQKLRVEKSCRLLAESKRPVTEIALAVGYCDMKHFEQVFKRDVGITPREFRRQTRNGR